MKLSLSDIAEEQGRAYARALVEAERMRALPLEQFAEQHRFPDPERPGVSYSWCRQKPAWREYGDSYERWCRDPELHDFDAERGGT